MILTHHEFWNVLHGMVFGGVFLLAFAGGLEALYGLRPDALSGKGLRGRVSRMRVGVVAMAVTAWAAVLTGTWVVYPWYREPGPASSKSVLLSKASTAGWHEFGMEWKEHIAWISPILASVVAFVVVYYGTSLMLHDRIRKTVMALFVLAFLSAAVAGALGALINKAAIAN